MTDKMSKEHIDILLRDVTALINTLHLMEANDPIEEVDIRMIQELEQYKITLKDRLLTAITTIKIIKQNS